jgi:pullulanase
VSDCHDRGIHVIMDGVYNHVSRDFPYPQFYRDPATCPFTARTFVKAFPGLQDLDFANACTGEFIAEVPLLDRHLRHRRHPVRQHRKLLPSR